MKAYSVNKFMIGEKHMHFGEILKDLRLKAGLTQKQLAEQIGVSKSVVSFYELSERIPSPTVLIKLSSVFHVSADYLLGIESAKRIDISGVDDEDAEVIKAVIALLRKKNENMSPSRNTDPKK